MMRPATSALPTRSLFALSLLATLGLIVLAGLGTWQLQRMAEKQAFLARLAAQSQSAPAALPPAAQWDRLDLASADLRRVTLSGDWIAGATATVRVVMPEARPGERQPGGFGRYLIAAVKLDGGEVVLVNRGFAPESAVAALPAPAGRATIVGLLRRPEAGNAFTPAPNAAARDFHLRDPAAIAGALGLKAAPFMVEAERGGDAGALPVGVNAGELIARIPNNHLQYSLTWFGLALTLAGVFIAYVRSVRRPTSPDGGAADEKRL